ncbi:hypothetical protein PGQ11_005971 [Apiospora arundinis]|uniref:C2H2-type domain-containing protein n=1 Tax=Apiospora arundinis TaxID=335852 RepID=A0ABR2IRU2_9PEZI
MRRVASGVASDATSGIQSMVIQLTSLKYIKGLSGLSYADIFSGRDYTIPPPQIHRDVDEGFDFLDASDGDSDVDSHPSETEDSVFGSQKFSLRLTIEQLARFSSMMRRSGTKFRFTRADSRLVESDHLEFQEELSTSILLGSLRIDPSSPFAVKVLESNTFDQLTIVQKRLVRGNIFRRNRIMHATKSMPASKQNPKKGDNEMLKPLDAGGGGGLSGNNTTDIIPQRQQSTPQGIQAERKSTPSLAGTQMTRLTAITATEIGPHFKPGLATLKSSRSIATEVTKTGYSQDYPRCPNPITDGFIKCPYCADMLPAGYKKNVTRWKWVALSTLPQWRLLTLSNRGHVAQDILPYMCVYEDCHTPGEMYLTSDDLHKHVQEHHSVLQWVCSQCSRNPDRRQFSTFNTISEWQEHFQDTHKNMVPKSGLASLARFSEARVLQPTSCPLCGFSAGGVQTILDEHIIQHIHKFALRSLPWGTNEDDAENISSIVTTETDRDNSFDDNPVPFFRPAGDVLVKELEYSGNILHLFLDRPKFDFSIFCRGMDSNSKSDVVHRFETLASKYIHICENANFEKIGNPDLGADVYLPLLMRVENTLHTAVLEIAKWGGNFEMIEGVPSWLDGSSHTISSMLDEVEIELQTATDDANEYDKYVNTDHSPDRKSMCFEIPLLDGPAPSSTIPIGSEIVNNGSFMLVLSGPTMSRKTHNASHYARSMFQANPYHVNVFWIDVQSSDLGRATRIDRYDQVFGEIGLQLLGMDDLLGVLAVADRGAAFVDAMLHSMNNKSRDRWLIILDGVNTTLDVFFSGVRLPSNTVRGMLILTTRSEIVPRLISCAWLDTRFQAQSPYDALEVDNRIDNILLPGDTLPQYNDRPGLISSTGLPRLVNINLIRPTPPSSPTLEQQHAHDLEDSKGVARPEEGASDIMPVASGVV